MPWFSNALLLNHLLSLGINYTVGNRKTRGLASRLVNCKWHCSIHAGTEGLFHDWGGSQSPYKKRSIIRPELLQRWLAQCRHLDMTSSQSPACTGRTKHTAPRVTVGSILRAGCGQTTP